MRGPNGQWEGGTASSGGTAFRPAGCDPVPAPPYGNGSTRQWFLDAENSSDVNSGTLDSPLRTLVCAARVAKPGDGVNLLDGTWNASVDPKLGNGETTACGVSSGIAFAQDVHVAAVHSGAVRITGTGYHGICMSGGRLSRN